MIRASHRLVPEGQATVFVGWMCSARPANRPTKSDGSALNTYKG
ncbi:hypothetical protein Sgleb_67370 [Streptomyces glebosus]|uniref:Uncharacterized protein n=1 Tax=Streptomyces glebosus TaxID=249580 RepID=A0A640T680_9ACTN|nr:hypothetical protein [Streptomyces glebosus]GFE18690.1 hypothetical protein Sgleb_67370 [Streptomyces glebosus]GHG87798.1 hypothetical protein GCM10010513_69650 [Streptomyces glebosus]